MNLPDVYARALQHAINEDRTLVRGGFPPLANQDIDPAGRAIRMRYWVENAGLDLDADDWLQVMYHAASAYLAGYEADVVQIHTGDAA